MRCKEAMRHGGELAYGGFKTAAIMRMARSSTASGVSETALGLDGVGACCALASSMLRTRGERAQTMGKGERHKSAISS